MSETIENYNFSDVEGPYKEDALNAFDEEYLMDMPPNQLEWMRRQDIVELWMKWVDELDIAPGSIAIRFHKIRKHIAANPPELRCPCKRGYVYMYAHEHYQDCSEKNARESEEGLVQEAVLVVLDLEAEGMATGTRTGVGSKY